MDKNPSFSIGDTAVYPSHGVADIVDVQTMTIGEQTLAVYHLKFRDSGLKITVPVHKAEENGMRPLANTEDVAETFRVLGQRDIPSDRQTWNRRYRNFMEKIRTGSLLEVAEVYRDISLLKTTKTLSHGEREMLNRARDLLVKELAIAQSTPETEVETRLDSMFTDPPA